MMSEIIKNDLYNQESEDRLRLCFEHGCRHYGDCALAIEGLVGDDVIAPRCAYFWLKKNRIEVRNNDASEVDEEVLWSKASRS